MPRFALKLGDEILDVVKQLTGNDASEVFGDNIYMVLTLLDGSEFTEFNMKLMTEEMMFEHFKNDSDLHIVQF